MNNLIQLFLIFVIVGLTSCKGSPPKKQQNASAKSTFIEIIQEDYELYKPAKNIKAVLILFGGYPENATDIKREFKILEIAKSNDVAVVLLNYNQKLWLDDDEKYQLAKLLLQIIEDNQLPSANIYIGGFSSGGVISLLISNYIVGMKQFYIDPQGVFIIDSPIDLSALYHSSEKNIERNFSEVSVRESTFLLETLGGTFGDPKKDIKPYENNAVFTYSSKHTSNLQKLKETKIRLYTEPDTLWWKEHRMADYEQMNAYYIKKLAERLREEAFENVEYIPTTSKGYRANGERHPHSWSIVDVEELINWMLEE